MKNILKAPWMISMIRACTDMYGQGWDERNGGNISMLLSEEEVAPYVSPASSLRTIETGFEAKELEGRYILVTGTGKYFKNVQYDPADGLGLFRIGMCGKSAELLWGLTDGGGPTSELPAHLMSHAVRLGVDKDHRVIMHCHPTNMLAMTFVHELDEKSFTLDLWRMCSECIVVFPDGINVLPWMLCGTKEIGQKTAEKMKTARIIVWAQHGIYGAGRSLDEAYGLIETAEKAAEVYMKIAGLPRLNEIKDDQLRMLADRYGVTPRDEYLSE